MDVCYRRGQSLAVFVDQLRPGSRVKIAEHLPGQIETLGTIATGTSVTRLIPTLGDIPMLD